MTDKWSNNNCKQTWEIDNISTFIVVLHGEMNVHLQLVTFCTCLPIQVEVGNPNMVWSASEDGTLRQHDFREGTSCPPAGSSRQECRNVLVRLTFTMKGFLFIYFYVLDTSRELCCYSTTLQFGVLIVNMKLSIKFSLGSFNLLSSPGYNC